jgi:hypothetical protein
MKTNSSSSVVDDKTIWFKDLESFVSLENLLHFVPVKGTTIEEQLNSILRFSIYTTIILALVPRDNNNTSYRTKVMLVPVVVAIGTYLMYVSSVSSSSSSSSSPFTAASAGSSSVGEGRRRSDQQWEGFGVEQQGGGRPAMRRSSSSAAAAACTKPTRDNPFMNVLPFEYETNPDRSPACDIQRSSVQRRAEALFEQTGSLGGLPRNSDDIFHRSANSRQFVTNPVTTIPNDQTGFANWLYRKEPEVKRAPVSTFAS